MQPPPLSKLCCCAARRSWTDKPRRTMMMVATLVLCAVSSVHALDGVLSVGGTYRYGHVYWRSDGDVTEFTVEAAFKRHIEEVSSWSGTAVDNLAKVGDEILFPGRQPPQFYYGDGMVEQRLTMKVTAYSVAEDWVMGEATFRHQYATPNNRGEPWYAQFTGCCRYSYLMNNKDAEWVITAEVDLNKAQKSPRANVLPVVSVPFQPVAPKKPSVYVPSEDSAGRTIEYRVGKPWAVGNSAVFSAAKKSFIAVPLSNLAPYPCGRSGASFNYAGPGCLFKSLRTEAGQRAMTVEGWVFSNTDAGGYVLSVGADDGYALRSEGYGGPEPVVDCKFGTNAPTCRAASLLIRVTNTHVIVGHEVGIDAAPREESIAFEICSNSYLNNEYLCAPAKSATGKWFHVAVTRFQHKNRQQSIDGADMMVSYKVRGQTPNQNQKPETL
jgi:hypothetical protein